MTRPAERAGVHADKRKLSKYETALESAYRQTDIHTTALPGTAETLAKTPHMVVIPDGDNSSTSVTLPTGYFETDKLVEVVNNDTTAEAVFVGGVSCTAGEKTTLHFDGSSWTKLFSVALA